MFQFRLVKYLVLTIVHSLLLTWSYGQGTNNQIDDLKEVFDSNQSIGQTRDIMSDFDSLSDTISGSPVSQLTDSIRADSLVVSIEKMIDLNVAPIQNDVEFITVIDKNGRLEQMKSTNLELMSNQKMSIEGINALNSVPDGIGNNSTIDALSLSVMPNDGILVIPDHIFSLTEVNQLPELNSSVSLENVDMNFELDVSDKYENFLQEEISKITEFDQLEIETNKIEVFQSELNQYTEKIETLKEGGLRENTKEISKQLEQKAKSLAGIEKFQEQAMALDKLKEQPEAYKKKMAQFQNKDFLKEQLENRATDLGSDLLSVNQEKFNAAQLDLSKYKKRYAYVENTKYLPERRPNALKGKPFHERFMMGFNLQVNKGLTTGLDVSPTIGYRISGLFSAGLGATHRLDFGHDGRTFNNDREVYGYRGLFDINFFKGFYVRGEYERLNTEIPAQQIGSDDIVRDWVPGAYLGVGKRYSITRNVKGYVLALNNFKYEHNRTPYQHKFILKFGIEWKISKNIKRKELNEMDNR